MHDVVIQHLDCVQPCPVMGPTTLVVARGALVLSRVRLWFAAGMVILPFDQTSKPHISPSGTPVRYNHGQRSQRGRNPHRRRSYTDRPTGTVQRSIYPAAERP